ncbi:MAG: hypothetical protein ACYC3H_08485 [Bellilinea sp.]
MIPNLSENARKVYRYLQSIYPEGATTSEIEEATLIHPHAQVFQLTRRLTEKGLLSASKGRDGEREWVFHFQTTGKQPILGRIENKSGDYRVDFKPEILDISDITPKKFDQLAAHKAIRASQVKVIRDKAMHDEYYGFILASPKESLVGIVMVTNKRGTRCPSCNSILQFKSLRKHYKNSH